MSASWKASLPIMLRETWPVSTTRGTESKLAVASPVTVLVAPGPLVTRQTPDASRGPRVAVGRVHGALLVAGKHQPQLPARRTGRRTPV